MLSFLLVTSCMSHNNFISRPRHSCTFKCCWKYFPTFEIIFPQILQISVSLTLRADRHAQPLPVFDLGADGRPELVVPDGAVVDAVVAPPRARRGVVPLAVRHHLRAVRRGRGQRTAVKEQY